MVKIKIDRNVKRYRRLVTKINKLEPEIQKLSDRQLQVKTAEFKRRLQNGETLQDILLEVYAVVREAGKRVLGLRAYNVQLQGALAVFEEKIVEMKTGEGKTLTITFPAYLKALLGQGVHVVTANDYLAERDASEMGKLYKFLGLTVDYITSKTSHYDRQVAYRADITYLTPNEVGFDYLRDNMLYEAKNRRQRGLFFAIVDEVDSVLIDEAQVPLVISNNKDQNKNAKEIYLKLKPIVESLQRDIDYKVNEKEQVVSLTPMGISKIEKALGVSNLYEGDIDYIYYITRLLKAYALFKKDRDYIVDEGQVIIVDEFTGRLMYNHRYYQGIHQAIEAKEGLMIRDENTTLASITFQLLFKKYKGLAGLTGTALSAKKEFRMLFGKQVVAIPTNKPIRRIDKDDKFFVAWEDKMNYLAWTTQEYYLKNGATLIGTRSVLKSEDVYKHLMNVNVPAQVLNAKHARREAEIIARAGQPQRVTVATNMAGRGTDIKLADEVRKAGGLMVLGTERYNARRIDNQLIGRAGRQGDPGMSQFLISADDVLIKTYFREQYLKAISKHSDTEKGVEDKKLTKIINKAQKRMEDSLFEQRLLSYEFDKVLDKQRNSFYKQRNRVLQDDNLKEETLLLIEKEIYHLLLARYTAASQAFEKTQIRNVVGEIKTLVANEKFNEILDAKVNAYLQREGITGLGIKEVIKEAVLEYYSFLEDVLTPAKIRLTEKTVTLKVLDLLWVRHLQQVTEMQEAAMVLAITRGDFFTDYEMRMDKVYRQMLLSVPRIVTLTFFRTVNRLLANKFSGKTEVRNDAQSVQERAESPFVGPGGKDFSGGVDVKNVKESFGETSLGSLFAGKTGGGLGDFK